MHSEEKLKKALAYKNTSSALGLEISFLCQGLFYQMQYMYSIEMNQNTIPDLHRYHKTSLKNFLK